MDTENGTKLRRLADSRFESVRKMESAPLYNTIERSME